MDCYVINHLSIKKTKELNKIKNPFLRYSDNIKNKYKNSYTKKQSAFQFGDIYTPDSDIFEENIEMKFRDKWGKKMGNYDTIKKKEKDRYTIDSNGQFKNEEERFLIQNPRKAKSSSSSFSSSSSSSKEKNEKKSFRFHKRRQPIEHTKKITDAHIQGDWNHNPLRNKSTIPTSKIGISNAQYKREEEKRLKGIVPKKVIMNQLTEVQRQRLAKYGKKIPK